MERWYLLTLHVLVMQPIHTRTEGTSKNGRQNTVNWNGGAQATRKGNGDGTLSNSESVEGKDVQGHGFCFCGFPSPPSAPSTPRKKHDPEHTPLRAQTGFTNGVAKLRHHGLKQSKAFSSIFKNQMVCHVTFNCRYTYTSENQCSSLALYNSAPQWWPNAISQKPYMQSPEF